MVKLYKTRMAAAFYAFLLPVLSWADTFALSAQNEDLVGATLTVKSRYEDTLLDIARANDLGYTEMRHANPQVAPWLPGEGTEVVLPKQFILPPVERRGIIINLAEMRIYYFPEASLGKASVVITHPIGIGRMDWTTPLGKTHIAAKIKDPTWYPPKSILEEHAENGSTLPNSVPPGPDNPLGAYALQLAIPGYLIHGTNKPWGVGMRTSHGCIRMLPEDIETFYWQVSSNTPVNIINMPIKVGWYNEELYLEVHPALDDDTVNLEKGMTGVVKQVIAATRAKQIKLDWKAIEDAYQRSAGIPTKISVPISQKNKADNSEAP